MYVGIGLLGALVYMIIEVEKFHDMLSTTGMPPMGIILSECKSLRTSRIHRVTLSLRQRP